MKPRLLIRALCVGAALLVPAGGLTVLGVGTAGASTIQTTTTSDATLGTLGTMTMSGILCTIPLPANTTTVTYQCSIKAANIAPKPGKFKIFSTGTNTLTALPTAATKLLVKVKNTAGVNKIIKTQIKSAWNVILKGKGTNAKFNGCKLLSGPAITYTQTGSSGLIWKTTTNSLSTVTVTDTSSVGTCTGASTVRTDLTGHKLAGKITFNGA